MPTYNYECAACGHAFEKFQTMSAKIMRKCPECKKIKLERLIGSGAGIIFKGSGFYETDYRGKSYSADQKKDQGECAESSKCPAADSCSAANKAKSPEKQASSKKKSEPKAD